MEKCGPEGDTQQIDYTILSQSLQSALSKLNEAVESIRARLKSCSRMCIYLF